MSPTRSYTSGGTWLTYALILHVNGVPMIIIGIPAYIHIHPECIKDSVCIELLGVLCTPLKNIGGAQAPLAPPSYAYAK